MDKKLESLANLPTTDCSVCHKPLSDNDLDSGQFVPCDICSSKVCSNSLGCCIWNQKCKRWECSRCYQHNVADAKAYDWAFKRISESIENRTVVTPGEVTETTETRLSLIDLNGIEDDVMLELNGNLIS